MSDLSRLERKLHCCRIVLWLKKCFQRAEGPSATSYASIGIPRGSSDGMAMKHEGACYNDDGDHHDHEEDSEEELLLRKSSVYKAYLDMCRSECMRPLLKPPGLGKMVSNAFPGVVTKRRGPRGRVIQFYIGLQPVTGTNLRTLTKRTDGTGKDRRRGARSHDQDITDVIHEMEEKSSHEVEFRQLGQSGSGEWSVMRSASYNAASSHSDDSNPTSDMQGQSTSMTRRTDLRTMCIPELLSPCDGCSPDSDDDRLLFIVGQRILDLGETPDPLADAEDNKESGGTLRTSVWDPSPVEFVPSVAEWARMVICPPTKCVLFA